MICFETAWNWDNGKGCCCKRSQYKIRCNWNTLCRIDRCILQKMKYKNTLMRTHTYQIFRDRFLLQLMYVCIIVLYRSFLLWLLFFQLFSVFSPFSLLLALSEKQLMLLLHHILALLIFNHDGYSDEFTENFRTLLCQN